MTTSFPWTTCPPQSVAPCAFVDWWIINGMLGLGFVLGIPTSPVTLCFKFNLGNKGGVRDEESKALQSLSYTEEWITVCLLLEELPTTRDKWCGPQKLRWDCVKADDAASRTPQLMRWSLRSVHWADHWFWCPSQWKMLVSSNLGKSYQTDRHEQY